MNTEGQFGLYIHWPFCLSKCPYCDFNTHVHDSIDYERWERAYLKSLEHYATMLPERRLASIFFGGGTPSLMRPDTVAKIVDKARSLWRSVNDLEITLEANPTSIEAQKFAAFKDAGVSRVSVGVQALNDADLKFLGREHSKDEALKALEVAGAHFDRFSFDLIYARPEQDLDAWRAELEYAASIAKGHLSLYQLTIERNTPFYFDHAQGVFDIPDEDQAIAFYEVTQDVLRRAGFPRYEVSNHAAEDHESRHNMIYWLYGDYVGIGPGAHGRLSLSGQKYATREHHAPEPWLTRVEERGCGAHPFEALSAEDQFTEGMMMGLRLVDGVALERLSQIGGQDWQEFVDMDRLRIAQNEGWLELRDGRLILSDTGTLRLNALIPYLLKVQPEQRQATAQRS